jgi:hypothetical protein
MLSASVPFPFDKYVRWFTLTEMSENTSETTATTANPPAVFPDANAKPFSLQVVENYLAKCEEALSKLQESMVKLKANMKQREEETIAVNAQKSLLLALQKDFVKDEPNKK